MQFDHCRTGGSATYLPLAAENLGRIVLLHLDRVVTRMREQHDIALTYSDAVVSHIVERCPVGEIGARQLISFIEQIIQPQLAKLWLGALAEKRQLLAIDIRLGDSAELLYHPQYLPGRATPAIPAAESA